MVIDGHTYNASSKKEDSAAENPIFIDEKDRYHPRGGELYVHSHVSEPEYGLDSDGLGAVDAALFEIASDHLRAGSGEAHSEDPGLIYIKDAEDFTRAIIKYLRSKNRSNRSLNDDQASG